MNFVQIIDDNQQSPVSSTGRWDLWTNQGVNQSVHEGFSGTGADVFSWNFTNLTPGLYRVAVTWFPYINRATNSPFSVYDGTKLVGTQRVNQQLTPNEFTDNGVGWKTIGTFPISGSILTTKLSNDANGNLNADAVRIERVGDLPPVPQPSTTFDITLRFDSSITLSQQATIRAAADRWQQLIVGDVPDVDFVGWGSYPPSRVDDIIVDVFATAIDGSNNVLASAFPSTLRTPSWLPVHGVMRFDTADIASLEATGQLYNVAVHELAHALGFGTIWSQKKLINGDLFIGANAVREYRNIFGGNPTGVPLETIGGAGTIGSHWSDSILGNEALTGYLNPGANPVSRITVGSFEDLGYKVNYEAADPYPTVVIMAGEKRRID